MAEEIVELAGEVIGEVVGGAIEVASGSSDRSSRRGCRRFLLIGFIVVIAAGVAAYFLL